ncbi:MAG: outer membrane protein transport protein [Rhodospirillaceae bacterium]
MKYIYALRLLLVSMPMLIQSAHATDGYFMHGNGGKAKGMAGVAIAFPQDAMSVVANPAAASAVGHNLDIGLDLFVPRRSAEILGNAFGSDEVYSGNGTSAFILPEFGYVRPLSDQFAFAFTVNANGGINTNYKVNPFGRFGATGPASMDLKQAFITPTLSMKVAPKHSVGVSIIGLAQVFKVKGITPFSGASSNPVKVTDNGAAWSTGAGMRVGWLGQITDHLKLGAFYQSKVWATKFDSYAGLFAGQGSFDVPASWGGGVSYEIQDGFSIAFDVKRIEYSGVPSVGTPLTPLFSGVPFGADNGPGFGWRDITVFKSGISYALNESLTLRAGYGRSGQPIPRSQTFLNTVAPGVVQDHFTVGGTWGLRSNMDISTHVLYAPKVTVRGQGSIPPGLPSQGGFGGGEVNLSLAEFSGGVSFTYHY